MNMKNPKVDAVVTKNSKWLAEGEALRSILLECKLTEELKWYQPCYSFNGSNIVIIGELKDSCVLGFFKGVLLTDPKKILIQQTKNTQSARIIKFKSIAEIHK